MSLRDSSARRGIAHEGASRAEGEADRGGETLRPAPSPAVAAVAAGRLTAIFFLIHLTPGGPEAALANNPRTSPEEIQRLRERFGLTDPLPMQYLRWLTSAAHLDFGRSYFYSRPAIDVVGRAPGPDHPARAHELPGGHARRAARRPGRAAPRANGRRRHPPAHHARPRAADVVVRADHHRPAEQLDWLVPERPGQRRSLAVVHLHHFSRPRCWVCAALVAFHPLHALGGAGSAGPGLRADRARQGSDPGGSPGGTCCATRCCRW